MLILAVGAWVGWRRMPGVNGPQEELYWLLDHDKVAPQDLNLAGNIIRFAEERQPGQRVVLLRSLLSSKNEHLVQGALALLADQVEPPGRGGGELRRVFAEWFSHATVEEKVLHLRPLLRCCVLATTSKPDLQNLNSYPVLPPREWDVPMTKEDWRWLIAGTLMLNGIGSSVLDLAVFPVRIPVDDVLDRLRFLDGITSWSVHDAVASGRLGPISEHNLARQLPIPLADLTTMLSDPIREVRWGAGRIFAVAGDRRGLPALREWLKEHPARAKACDELMTPLFGPNWRSDVESGSATSPPRARDGGG
jgi:hypothetical protein